MSHKVVVGLIDPPGDIEYTFYWLKHAETIRVKRVAYGIANVQVMRLDKARALWKELMRTNYEVQSRVTQY